MYFAIPASAPQAARRLPSIALSVMAALAALLLVPSRLPAQQAERPAKRGAAAGRTAAELITPAAEASIERGLEFLSRGQRDDGSFGPSGYAHNVGVCGLAGMAFMSGGSTPGRGPYGAEINKCVDFVLANTAQSGFINVPHLNQHGPMYGHGFGTMFLAETYGMTFRSDHRDKLNRAVALIINTQNAEGGWRYQPQREQQADISVTVSQVMALRAARNAGLSVPKETMDRAVAYIERCQNQDGGFMYQAAVGGESGFARTAAAVAALNGAGIYEGPVVEGGLAYLARFVPSGSSYHRESYYVYGHYYAVQVMWQAGDAAWLSWYPAIRDELVAHQNSDGSWSDPIGGEYGTAMATLILQVPQDWLPIFQR